MKKKLFNWDELLSTISGGLGYFDEFLENGVTFVDYKNRTVLARYLQFSE
jgi:hypothetical protein